MATIVFSTVGSLLGGPVGGAIGSLIGRQFDAALFGPGGREGPRLKELAVTASSYGVALPRHFGRIRTAGSIIWATELVEHSEATGGGKGAPTLTTYSYTANFAVALASRPILGLGRIWADGRLLRGADGDLKVAGTLRIHTGEGDQAADPLIVAAQGAARAPACRGIAYVVFEDLDLSEYYNHIPALTFEVVADESFDLSALATGTIESIEASVPLEGVSGYSSEGALAEDLQILDPLFPLDVDAAGETLLISRRRLQAEPVVLTEPAVAGGDDGSGTLSGHSRHRAPQAEQPPTVLRYLDTARDYQPGAQRASGRAGPGEPRTIELPAALDPAAARALIEGASRRIDWTRDRISWRTAALDPAVGPGTLVTLPEIEGVWRVREWEWREAGVELNLDRVPPAVAPTTAPATASHANANPASDLPPAATTLVAFELPLDGLSSDPARPRTFAAVSAATANWAGAALYANAGDGAMQPLGPSGRARSILGRTTTALAAASPLMFDRRSTLDVTLVDPAMPLRAANARQLAGGSNLALIGDEIVQFARAEPLGSGRWRLRGLLRGRGGTENAVGGHLPDEPFVLISSPVVALDPAPLGAAAERRVLAIGRGDADPVEATVVLDGITLRPLAPVHPRRQVLADGTWRLRWTRRARGGWTLLDGVDVPLVEQTERYLVTLGSIGAPAALWWTATAQLELTPTTIADLSARLPGGLLQVRQQGTSAMSEPLLLCALP